MGADSRTRGEQPRAAKRVLGPNDGVQGNFSTPVSKFYLHPLFGYRKKKLRQEKPRDEFG